MKVLLINPPFYRYIGLQQDYIPLSLLAVGSKMVQDGHEVYLKNMEVGVTEYAGYHDRFENYDLYIDSLNGDNKVWDELRDTINKVKPDKIGINVLNVKYQSALKVIKIAKEENIQVIVGGNHPTNEPTSYPEGVEVFCGEYESGGGRILNLDETPMPEYDMLLDEYSPDGCGHILSSRGCPFKCKFCSSKLMWHRKVTYKSVTRILAEMTQIYDRFHTEQFTFWDETFTLNKKRIFEFCKRYSLPAKWRCDTRADSLTEELVVAMKDAGCSQMSLGLECADNETLTLIGKGETVEDFQRAADILNKHNIQWKAYSIIGFPSDTEEIILKSVEFIKSLKPFRITVSFFTPYKGTELYEEVKALGLINDNYDMSLFSHQSPHNYFCPKIKKEVYLQLRDKVTKDIDLYNKEALKTWK